MKNLMVVVLAVVMLIVVAGFATAKSEEWKVVKINCPNLLAEKVGEKKVFRFQPARSMNISMALNECRKMGGGTIIVEENGKYYFFPPILK